jgi:Bifunctional DNA primase/polymerase, N-terminal
MAECSDRYPYGERFSVLDIDKKNGKDGFIHVPDWASRSPLIATTGTGGAHLYFQPDPLVGCSTEKIALGVDTKGHGGYIIVPPSPGYRQHFGRRLCAFFPILIHPK